ncbi:MAG TPA: sigma-54 dependent transcriptional regulator [Steroidobacteraceae bacterium]|nr:sigma-54 dependent transcriptional regulator [Steroidobacteraceae bacterium]
MKPEPADILIVDDDSGVLLAAELVLQKHFRNVVATSEPRDIRQLLGRQSFEVLLLDMNFSVGATSGQEGLDWLQRVQELAPDTKVILMTAYGGVEAAVNAIRKGAADFVVKPWDNAKLIATVTSVARLAQADREVASLRRQQRSVNEYIGQELDRIVGAAPGLRQMLLSINKVARTDASVLILGENGTGKELAARAIHSQSLRSDRVFVSVDLGAISETLFESELFGHRKGAFTDAREDRAGRFEIANGGTLFLDEIGNLSLKMQAKLLGALETKMITRLGSDRPIKIDSRVICATNLPAEQLRDPARFRQDLLYRINTIEIPVPPLRERIEDVPLLVAHYAALYAKRYGKPEPHFDPPALERLQHYPWPGNVRELRHVIERAIIMSDNRMAHLEGILPPPATDSATLNLEQLEKQAIQKAIAKHEGNLSKAAQSLGLGRTTLYRKMARYGIE